MPEQPQPQQIGGGLRILLYIVSFFFFIVGFILYFVYKGRPDEESKAVAGTILKVSIASVVVSGLCCILFFVLPAILGVAMGS